MISRSDNIAKRYGYQLLELAVAVDQAVGEARGGKQHNGKAHRRRHGEEIPPLESTLVAGATTYKRRG